MAHHTNPIPPYSFYIWTSLSLFTLESDGQATYMDTHPKSWCRLGTFPNTTKLAHTIVPYIPRWDPIHSAQDCCRKTWVHGNHANDLHIYSCKLHVSQCRVPQVPSKEYGYPWTILRATSHISQEPWPCNCESLKESVQRPSQHTSNIMYEVWSPTFKCIEISYVTEPPTKCYFDDFFILVGIHTW